MPIDNIEKYSFERVVELRATKVTMRSIAQKFNMKEGSFWKRWGRDKKKRNYVEPTKAIVAASIVSTKRRGSTRAKDQVWELQGNPDTISLGWREWADQFLKLKLFAHQLYCLREMDIRAKLEIKMPRRSGKSYAVTKVFIIRKMVEQQYRIKDEPITYFTSVTELASEFAINIREELEENTELINYYGFKNEDGDLKLVDEATKNTERVINMLRKRSHHFSFRALKIQSRARGIGARWLFIDDPIDVDTDSEIALMTKKVLRIIRGKLTPIVKGGSIFLIGTRYDIKDIYVELMLGFTLWYEIELQTILEYGEYTIPEEFHINKDPSLINVTGEWLLLNPEMWEGDIFYPTSPNSSAIQNVIATMLDMKDREWQQEYQNNPLPSNPVIKWDWFRHYDELADNPVSYEWVVFVDVGVGEKDKADFTVLSLVAKKDRDFYLEDLHVFKKSASSKYRTIEADVKEWEEKLGLSLTVFIETIMNQRETFQYIRDETDVTVRPFEQAGRGSKEFRIENNIASDAEAGKVYVKKTARHLDEFKLEIQGFPHYEHDDIIDSIDSGIFILKEFSKEMILISG